MSMSKEFHSAVLRLTGIFVCVLAVTSIIFSSVIYRIASDEIDRGLRRQVVGFRGVMMGRPIIDEEATDALRKAVSDASHASLRNRLITTNIVVVLLGTGVSYWFARRTFLPIEKNVKNQERFTADASHELRTPLASMKTEIEVGLRDERLSVDDAREILASNLEEVDRLSDMVANLLRIARSGELGEKSTTSPYKIMQNILAVKEKNIAGTGAMITVSAPKKKVVVYQHIAEQILAIYLDNALKYRSQEVKISLEAELAKREVIFRVTDNGPGIHAHDIPRIFDRFYRADNSRTTQTAQKGHGLGLSIAKQLAIKAGGSVDVESEAGKGATFTLKLPYDTIRA